MIPARGVPARLLLAALACAVAFASRAASRRSPAPADLVRALAATFALSLALTAALAARADTVLAFAAAQAAVGLQARARRPTGAAPFFCVGGGAKGERRPNKESRQPKVSSPKVAPKCIPGLIFRAALRTARAR